MRRVAWIMALSVLALGFYAQRKFRTFPVYESNKDLTGKTVLITGGNGGLGLATALEFAKRGAKVVIAARNDKKSKTARDEIEERTNNRNIFCYHLDLEDFDSVRNFARKFDNDHENLDYLINNAGVLTLRGLSSNGYTRIFNINHFGHFLLTNLLMEKMQNQGKERPVRIISVSSNAHRIVGSIDYLEIQNSANNVIGDFISYGYSKLAIIYFTAELHRRYADDGITSYTIHPGGVTTGIVEEMPQPFKFLFKLVTSTFVRSPYLGAQTIMYCALDDDVTAESGGYFKDCGHSPLKGDYDKDEEAAAKLWNESLSVTKFRETEQ